MTTTSSSVADTLKPDAGKRGRDGGHVRATVRAKCPRGGAGPQALYVRHRIGMFAIRTREFADIARDRSGAAIAPIADPAGREKAG